MKKLLVIPMIVSFTLPALAGSTTTTTTKSYDSTTTSPVMGTDLHSDAEMIEAQEEDEFIDPTLDTDRLEQERMEERMEDRNLEEESEIDYSDRTRTNRERKALNTGSDASDDQ